MEMTVEAYGVQTFMDQINHILTTITNVFKETLQNMYHTRMVHTAHTLNFVQLDVVRRGFFGHFCELRAI